MYGLVRVLLFGVRFGDQTFGDIPESLIPEPDPTPNQPRRQLILNFTLKIPETMKTRGGRPRNVDPQTRPPQTPKQVSWLH